MKLPKKRPSKLRYVLPLLVLFAIAGGGWAYHYAIAVGRSDSQSAMQATYRPSNRYVVDEFPALSEVPIHIVIDKIGVDAAITPVGLTVDGMMDVPPTNQTVGWYDQSAKAGESQYAILLDGHFGSDKVAAVFHHLSELVAGDVIEIQGEQGAVLKYQVDQVDQHYTEDVDMKKALYPYNKGRQSLTIITCDGNYDTSTETYDQRTIVYADRIA